MDPRRLREETRAEHEATEALMPLTGEGLTRDLYVRTLAVLYPLLASWERWSSQAAPESLRSLVSDRRRSHLLAADLSVMGGKAEQISSTAVNWESALGCGDLSHADPRYYAAFVGVLYVLEGSTLGGRYIARHVETVLGLKPGEGDAYFQGHGEATGSMWREVTALIAEIPESLAPVVIAAAQRTFRAFGRVLEEGELAPPAVHGGRG